MKLSSLCLAGAAASVLQFLFGGGMVLFGVSTFLLVPHVLIGIVLLVLSVLAWSLARSPVLKRMAIGNVALVIITGGLGVFVYLHEVPWVILLHLFLALGLLSNFSVMYGMTTERR
ncbi:hypothetical protein HS1genome_2091 [Sulfodiicoccus acidiphilus]|uniref:Uncharacterized protein n=1 Tax=Sulfodiicoccus acidiphilus TaxID=1670455 RepID=A0A348B6A0_9CREN|nr:hypothetical protein [Sulfodiicoccus acidiphilus]BBD73702.1 hypothetical protein HS1genome_2091 [Sulfodiicoccus acidiphilus]GGT97747.1 hypothetical protein GCM10007116_14090 [Sulfodiicoccus acidiphilus]